MKPLPSAARLTRIRERFAAPPDVSFSNPIREFGSSGMLSRRVRDHATQGFPAGRALAMERGIATRLRWLDLRPAQTWVGGLCTYEKAGS